MFAATANVEEYADAVAFFKSRFPVTPEILSKLGEYAGSRAWSIAGVAQLDIVLQVHESIAKAIANGTSLDDWRKGIESKLTEAWGKRDSWHTELVFRNATQSSYNAGRMRQMRDPDVLALRPYWQFDGIADGRQSELCRECNSVVLPAEDPWWNTHSPQLHHCCRSRIVALRAATAEELGITDAAPDVDADEGFGVPPDLADPWRPASKDYPKELFSLFEQKTVPTEGVHFAELDSNVSEARQAATLSSLTEKGLLPFLEANPLDRLRLNASSGKRGANGWYERNLKGEAKPNIAVAMKRKPASFGQAFEPGKSWSVSSAATSQDDATKRTLIHEIGHHIHLSAGGDGSEEDKAIRSAFHAKDRQPITRYAAYNPREYFAESFSAYQFHRAEFERYDPVGFDMVQEVLRLRRVYL